MPNIIITKGTHDRFGALRPVFKHLLDAFIAENSIEIVYSITNTITYNELASKLALVNPGMKPFCLSSDRQKGF